MYPVRFIVLNKNSLMVRGRSRVGWRGVGGGVGGGGLGVEGSWMVQSNFRFRNFEFGKFLIPYLPQ